MLDKNRNFIRIRIFSLTVSLLIVGTLVGCKTYTSSDYVSLATSKRKDPKGYNYQDVLNDYNQAIKLDQKNIEAYNGRGDLLSRPIMTKMFDNAYDISYGTDYDIPDQEAAIDDFNEAIQIQPNEESYIKRAYSKIAKNVRHKRAKDRLSELINHSCQGVSDDIEKALEINSNYSDAYYLKAHCIDDLGQNRDDVLKNYEKAIELNPNNILAYYGRALEKKYSLNDEVGALADIEKMIEIDSSNPRNYEIRASYVKERDPRAAIEDYERAIKLYRARGQDLHIENIESEIRSIKSNL
jgi:tetratricopeptide (TPR) repeat protein